MKDLCWSTAEVLLNSRPSPSEIFIDGWLIRVAGGPVRRTNSVSPMRHRTSDFYRIVLQAENIYSRLQRPSIFKVYSFDDAIETVLADRNYLPQGQSRVLQADLKHRSTQSPPNITIDPGYPTEAWLHGWREINGAVLGDASDSSFLNAVRSLILPSAFVSCWYENRPVSLAYGVIHRDTVSLEAVCTHPAHRGRGYARNVVSGVMSWAYGLGCSQACLAVEADNTYALQLYHGLGYNRELYQYHYRRRDLDNG